MRGCIDQVALCPPDRQATGVRLSGLVFAHTRTTFLESYEVPSGGDWSVHRGGAILLEGMCEKMRLCKPRVGLEGGATARW
jgi:hypothetical protein